MMRLVGAVATLLFAAVGHAPAGETVVPALASDELVTVREVRYGEGGGVTGIVTNEGGAALHGVRLRILCSWRWKDETNPGTDDPSWGAEHRIGQIPARGEARFRHQGPPPPARDDGSFHVEVTVAGLRRVRTVPD